MIARRSGGVRRMGRERVTDAVATGQVTWADYARAEQFLPANATARIFNAAVQPNWIAGGDRFWYRRTGRDGATFVRVDPASGTAAPASDHRRLAAALPPAAQPPG